MRTTFSVPPQGSFMRCDNLPRVTASSSSSSSRWETETEIVVAVRTATRILIVIPLVSTIRFMYVEETISAFKRARKSMLFKSTKTHDRSWTKGGRFSLPPMNGTRHSSIHCENIGRLFALVGWNTHAQIRHARSGTYILRWGFTVGTVVLQGY